VVDRLEMSMSMSMSMSRDDGQATDTCNAREEENADDTTPYSYVHMCLEITLKPNHEQPT
jgi:hypothetical protein